MHFTGKNLFLIGSLTFAIKFETALKVFES